MKMVRILILCIVATIEISCVRNIKTNRIIDIVQNRNALDGMRVSVRGFVIVDALYVPYFVSELGDPSGDRITRSIDLNPTAPEIGKELVSFDKKCVILDGIFHSYSERSIKFGDLVSVYGALDVSTIRECGQDRP